MRKNIVVRNYESEICVSQEIQFTVFTLDLDEETRVIVYSGTDDSIIGWKEDFNMMFTFPTPAQKQAIRYLKKYSENKKLYIVGHSKGGNLAMYSTLHIREEVFENITIYNKVLNNLLEDSKYIALSIRFPFRKDNNIIYAILTKHNTISKKCKIMYTVAVRIPKEEFRRKEYSI